MRAVLFRGMDAFLEWWNRSAPPARSLVFQNPNVMAAWERTIGAELGAQCFAVRIDDDQGAPLLALFLCIRTHGRLGMRTLSFMDGGEIDYNGPVLFDPVRPVPADIWTHIRSVLPPFDIVALEKMPALIKGAENPLWASANSVHRMSGHAMTLPQSWAALMEQKGKHKTFKSILRKRRLLEQEASVRFLVAHAEAEQERVFDTLVRQKTKRLTGLGKYDLFKSPGLELFYRECAKLSNTGATHLSALCVNDEIVGTNFGFTDPQSYCGVLTTFTDGSWMRYSCGAIHMLLIMRWAIEAGLKEMDFGIGDEEYKMFWCDIHTPLRNFAGNVSLKARLRPPLEKLLRR